ncbi:MAG: hypothetical protein LWW85_14680, partial [Marinilabiliales bacterium]|nr:hypothetical protein [Marinilabiliales bacterium]
MVEVLKLNRDIIALFRSFAKRVINRLKDLLGMGLRAILLFLVSFILVGIQELKAQSFAINLGGTELSMINANRSLITNAGNNGLSPGSVWRYDNLVTTNGVTVYGLLRIVAASNASIPTLDDETPGTGAPFRFQPTLTTTVAGGWVQFEIEFFELYTNQNVYISNYYMTGVDIDGVEFYEISGYSSYIVDATCALVITPSSIISNGTRFYAGNTGELSGITFDNTRAFIAKFPHPATKISFVIGANGVVTARQFSAQFGSMGGTFQSIDTNYNPNPVLLISKTANTSVLSPGGVSQYTINVSNGGNTVDNVTLTDALPSEVNYVPNSTSVFIPASTTSKTVKDEFTNVTYTAQDGVAGIWKTNWIDNDNAANTGTIYVSGGKLTFANLVVNDAIERTVNLKPTGSSSNGATLSYDYAFTTALGTSALIAQLSTDGTNYTTVQTLTGNAASGTFTYTIPSNLIGPNTRLRFAISGAAWASGTKIVTIDNVQISYSYSKPDVTLTNAPGTLTDGSPAGSLVASGDNVTLEPNVTMAVTFNVQPTCSASGTKVNTATASCTGLATPVSASHTATVGPVSASATSFCAAGNFSFTASGATSNQTYRWYSTASGGSVLYTGNPYVAAVGAATTTYYATVYTPSTGCESARVPIVATYVPLSGTGTITESTAKNGASGTSYLATQSSVAFTLSGISGATNYTWDVSSITASGGSLVGPSNGQTIYLNFNNAGQNGTYTIKCTPSNGCTTGTQVSLSINITSPNTSYGISGHLYIDNDGCAGSSGSSALVNGTGVGMVGGQQLYAVLYDSKGGASSNGGVIESQAIDADGSFSFLQLRTT